MGKRELELVSRSDLTAFLDAYEQLHPEEAEAVEVAKTAFATGILHRYAWGVKHRKEIQETVKALKAEGGVWEAIKGRFGMDSSHESAPEESKVIEGKYKIRMFP